MKKIVLAMAFLMLVFSCGLRAQSVQIDMASVPGSAGATVQVPVHLYSFGGAQPAGLQLGLDFNPAVLTFRQASAGPVATAAGKSAQANSPSAGNLRLIVFGLNQNVMSDGIVAYLEFQIAAGAAPVATPLTASSASAAGSQAQNIQAVGGSGAVIVGGGVASPKEMFFTQVADGGGFITSFVLVNPAGQDTTALLELFKQDGSPLIFPLNDNYDNAFPVTIKAGGMTVLRSANTAAVTKAGWARVRSATAIGGSMIYGFAPAAGKLIEEAGLDPSVPSSGFSLSVDTRRSILSGVAVANPGSSAASLTLTLFDANGAQLNQKTRSLAALGQFAQMADEIFPENKAALANFTGLITLASSGSQVVGTTLRMAPDLNTFASIPVVSPGGNPEPNNLYFPQIADGGGFRTSFVLLNAGSTAVSGTLETFKSDGTALSLNLNGTTAASRPVTIPARGVAVLESTNQGSTTVTGWARVQANGPIGGSIVYAFLAGGAVQSEAGIDPSRKVSGFSLSVDTRSDFMAGVALANPDASTTVNCSITLYNSQGTQVGQALSLRLAPRQHLAKLVGDPDFFPQAKTGFTGVIQVKSFEGTVIGTTLRFSGDLKVFASIPVIF